MNFHARTVTREWFLPTFLVAVSIIMGPAQAQSSSEGEFGFWGATDEAGLKMVVQTAHYRVEIRPDSGASIGSFRAGSSKREFTAWHSDVMSGLLQEFHTADVQFAVTSKNASEDTITLSFRGRRRELRVQKTYEFYRDLPWFRVRLRFENHSSVPLSGRAAPELFNLMLPADGKPTGRELVCLDRVTGPRVMSSELFRHRLGKSVLPRTDGIGWVAVSDPAARAGLGLIFANGAPAYTRAKQNARGNTGVSLSYKRIPPGKSLKSEVLVVPFHDMAAVSSMHPAFMANVHLDSPAPDRVSLKLLALRWKLKDVSVVVRAYDAEGKELEAYDVVPLDVLHPGQIRKVTTRRSSEATFPAWIVPEVRSEGKLVDAFSIPLHRNSGKCPVDLPPVPRPELESLEQDQQFRPGPTAPVSERARKRGFRVWRFEGNRPDESIRKLAVDLAADECETVFLGLRAFKPLKKVRATLVPPGDDSQSNSAPLASSAAFLWRIEEEPDSFARMIPSFGTTLEEGELMWMALTVDADQLSAGKYGSRLVVEAAGNVLEVPLTVQVEKERLPRRSAFGLWYLADRPLDEEALSSYFAGLSRYGTSALIWPASDELDRSMARDLARLSLRAGIHKLGFTNASRGLSQERLMKFGEQGKSSPLAAARFAWLTSGAFARNERATSLAKMGFGPACALSRLRQVEKIDLSAYESVLIENGPAPTRIPELIGENKLRDDSGVWLYLDLRGANWQWAATRIRCAVWAAAWQGLSGLAVRCEAPCTRENSQSVLWHVIRDAVEEAALWREAWRAAQRLENAEFEDKEQQKQRALTLHTFVSTMGEEEDVLLRVAENKVTFRNVLRINSPDREKVPGISDFREAKSRLLEVLRDTRPLVDMKERRLFWHGVPLQTDGSLHWSIVSSGDDAAWKQAGRLQKKVSAVTGRTLEVSRQFRELPDSADSVDRLVWMVGPASEIDGVPERVSKALQAPQPPAVARVPPALVVNLPADWAALDALIGTFSSFPDVYSPASTVK